MLFVLNKSIISLLNRPIMNIITSISVCIIKYIIKPNRTDFNSLLLFCLYPKIIAVIPDRIINSISK